MLYLGRFLYHEESYLEFKPSNKKHIFLDLDNPEPKYGSPYIVDSGFTKLAESVSGNALPQYPDELDRFLESEYNGDFVSVIMKAGSAPLFNTYRYYDDRKFIIKDGEEYYVINLKTPDRWSGFNSDYQVTKSKAFIPELKDGKIALPNPEIDIGVMSPNKVLGFNFQSIFFVNSKGKEVQVY